MDGVQQLAARIERMQERMDRRFDEVNARIDEMNARIDEVDARLGKRRRTDGVDDSGLDVNDRIDEVQAVAIRGYITMIKRENGLYHESHNLAEVPFPDGLFPWGKEVDGPSNTRVVLPELRGVDAVRNLTAPQLYGFFRGYYPGEALPAAARCREKILLAIGRAEEAYQL